ncbi:MAG: ATPase, T2SS/T4P/T4SS family, partial [Ilumatobacteraceae bacterium]
LAETGHLVMASLHTNDAAQALDRIIDVFPAEKRDQIQTMLAGSLQGVVSQRLVPGVNGGRVAAYEVLMGTDAVRNLMREGKSRQLRNVVSTGAAEGMQTIEMDLARLVGAGLVTMDVAKSISAFPNEIQAQLATMRSQAQGAATMSNGQGATSGSAQPTPPPPGQGADGNGDSNGNGAGSKEPSGVFGRRRR